jgi:hypothetical protein
MMLVCVGGCCCVGRLYVTNCHPAFGVVVGASVGGWVVVAAVGCVVGILLFLFIVVVGGGVCVGADLIDFLRSYSICTAVSCVILVVVVVGCFWGAGVLGFVIVVVVSVCFDGWVVVLVLVLCVVVVIGCVGELCVVGLGVAGGVDGKVVVEARCCFARSLAFCSST